MAATTLTERMSKLGQGKSNLFFNCADIFTFEMKIPGLSAPKG